MEISKETTSTHSGSKNSETRIHPTAIVHAKAKLGKGTEVGPYSIVGENVEIGDRSTIQEHVVLRGHLKLGSEVQVYPFSVIGGAPQHSRYAGEPTEVHVGDRCVLRESVTIHRGTSFGNAVTKIGQETLIMAYTHVAHDCVVGNNVIIANAVQLAGHVTIGDDVTIGGHGAIAQFCRVGSYCYIAGGSVLRKDLAPFMTGKGGDFKVQGVNSVGLERMGFQKKTISELRKLYKLFYLRGLTVGQAKEKISHELGDLKEAILFLDFLTDSKVGFAR